MNRAVFVFFAFVLSSSIHIASAADSDPLQDICIADVNSTLTLNGFPCKPKEAIRVEDFIAQTLRSLQPTYTPNTFIATPVFVPQLPALNTAGVALIRGDLGPGGVNPPHIHPRASELVIIQEGTVQVGFIDTNNKLFVQILQKGDVIVVPRALVHFQINVGKTPAVFLAFFNSQNPGLVSLPGTLFGSNIPDDVLAKSFKLDQRTIATLKNKFSNGRFRAY